MSWHYRTPPEGLCVNYPEVSTPLYQYRGPYAAGD